MNKAVEGSVFGFLSVSSMLESLLLLAGGKRLAVAAGVTGLGKGFALKQLGKSLGTALMFGLKRFFLPIAALSLLVSGFKFLFGSSKETAENTAELVEFERERSRIDLGRSRFERLTAKLLNDQMLSSRLSEGMLTKGIPELIDAVNGVTGAVIGTATTDEVPVPVRR
jgi:hypothetical protein